MIFAEKWAKIDEKLAFLAYFGLSMVNSLHLNFDIRQPSGSSMVKQNRGF